MSRPIKEGIDYYPCDVDLMKDRKFRKAKNDYGAGNAIVVYMTLLGMLYEDKGYYLDYGQDKKEDVLWEVQSCLQGKYQPSIETVESIIEQLVASGLFSGGLFECESVITSVRAQKSYYRATADRKTATINYNYWLLSRNEMEELSSKHPILINFINRQNNDVNRPNNSINQAINTQSKVEETKVKETKVKETKVKDKTDDVDAAFIWELYPLKQGKATALKKIPRLIKEHSLEEIKRCIHRYQQYVEKRRRTDFTALKFQNGSTFFNSGYLDYLDANFDETMMAIPKPKTGNMPEIDERRQAAYEKIDRELSLDDLFNGC